ncbi:hypothetical protein PoB_007529600, partial [Plakobranchus ocellatus]
MYSVLTEYRQHLDVTKEQAVPQIQRPNGVAIASDGSILVAEEGKNILHLVSSQADWIKQL